MTYLYILIFSSGMSSDQIRRFEFPNQEACIKSLQALRIENKKEAVVTAFCANEKNHRNYNATWWIDPVKDAK